MKLLIPIFCAVTVFAPVLHGSTAELSIAEIRELISNGNFIKGAQDFVALSHDIVNEPNDFIKSVHALIDPLVENQQSNAAIISNVLFFFILLIDQLEQHYSQNQAIARQLANFSFNSVLYNGSVRNLPILNIAIISGYPDVTKQFLKIGSNVNGFDSLTGVTPLMTAAAFGYDDDALDFVKMLLQHGAKPSLQDKSSKTARDYALQAGHTKTAAYLYFAERHEADKSDLKESDFSEKKHS